MNNPATPGTKALDIGWSGPSGVKPVGLNSSESSRPFRPLLVSLALVLTLFALLVPALHGLNLLTIALLMFAAARLRLLFVAVLAGALLVVYGSAGRVPYFGMSEVQSETTSAALLFAVCLAIGLFAGSLTPGVKRETLVQVSGRTILVLSIAASLVLLTRFAGGIPLLAGDEGRLAGVAAINPYLGLLSGILPITAAYLPAKSSRALVVVQAIMTVLVVGTGSRLLLAAVMLGLVSRMVAHRRGNALSPWAAVAMILGVVGVLRIYEIRTDPRIIAVFTSRGAELDGIAGLATTLLGPSIYYSSRNGLVMFQLIQTFDLHAPAGFILGGLLKSVSNFGHDPERWLSTALGLDIASVGAVATPIWSGAISDFGPIGGCVLALLIGRAVAWLVDRFPSVVLWFCFAIVLSFYGSYLISAQFVFTTALMLGLLTFASVRNNRKLGSLEGG